MYDVMMSVLEVGYILLPGCCLQYFLGSFMESRRIPKRWNGVCTVFFYTVLRFGSDLLLPSDYGNARTLGRLMFSFGITMLLSFAFYHSSGGIRSFLVVVFLAVNEICFFLSHIFLQYSGAAYDLLFLAWERGHIDSAERLLSLTMILAVGMQSVFCILFVGMLYASLRSITKSFQEKDYPIHRTELLLLLTPSLAGILVCVLLRLIWVTVEDGIMTGIYDRFPLLLFFVPIMLVLCLLSILYGIRLFQDMIRLNRERNSRAILEKQVNGMQEHIAEMEHIYSGLRSMRHDMKNALSVVMQLAVGEEAGQGDDLKDYQVQLNQAFDRLEFKFQTGNTVADALLNMKYHEIMRCMPGLSLEADKLLFSEKLVIQNYDLGVILGNALDNAIEACKKLQAQEPEAELFIRLVSFSRGKLFFIEIENSFDGNVVRRRDGEFPETDKADKKVHGIGLANIKKTAEKYHGAVDWSVNNKVFTLSVMLKNERSEEDELWSGRQAH